MAFSHTAHLLSGKDNALMDILHDFDTYANMFLGNVFECITYSPDTVQTIFSSYRQMHHKAANVRYWEEED